jgi:flagellar assembly factor FliW
MTDQLTNETPGLNLTFPVGIPGFPEARSFLLSKLTSDPTNPYSILRSTDGLGPIMILTDPEPFFPGYMAEIDDQSEALLEVDKQTDLLLLISVHRRGPDEQATANLLGPFIINMQNGIGAQVSQLGDLALLQVPLTGV